MDVDWFYRILILFGLIIISAFFSGSEVALFSLGKKKLKNLEKENTVTGKYINELLKFPRRLLTTILIGNTAANVFASIVAVTLALDIANFFTLSVDIILIVQIIVLTILILIFGEVSPKVWANRNPVMFSRIVCLPVYWIGVLLYPISKILTDIMKVSTSGLRINKSKTAITSSEISELAELGVEKGSLEEEEHELIHGLVSFKTVNAREVMTPRVDMTAISIDTPFSEVTNIITDSGHSRIPLFKNDLDNIIGIIYAKDLLKFIGKKNQHSHLSLKTISRETIFVPETKLISELMKEFQGKNLHVGIVVDEYGGTSGIITLEDILEEIVGEIRDEFDKEENEITNLGESKYLILGKVAIDEVNELLGEEFSSESDDYDTIGGFIFNQAGNIPDEGYTFVEHGFTFVVKEIENNRINKVQVERVIDTDEV